MSFTWEINQGEGRAGGLDHLDMDGLVCDDGLAATCELLTKLLNDLTNLLKLYTTGIRGAGV